MSSRAHRPFAVVGRDPRASGEFLEAAVVAGLASAGVDVVRLGVVPTPGVAFLTADCDADLGVMLSASHNPMPDNGIKFFARGGNKLDDALEDAIESRMREQWARPTGAGVGRVTEDDSRVEDYVSHLVNSLARPVSLEGLKVVIDCANGAAYVAGPAALEAQGAEVVRIHAEPDGININDNCGSTHMDSLRAAVVAERADLGIALDGDADRCLAVDAEGKVVDGDQILAILALAMRESGRLKNDTVVATVMSNLGFAQAMQTAGITVEQTRVGDRYVLEAMKAGGFSLGGEQSGHVVMAEHATTGDGVLTALHLMSRMATSRTSLADLAAVMRRLPQVLINVPGVDKSRADSDAALLAAVAAAESDLGQSGRVLLRPSGTESLVRVMVEAATYEHGQRGRLPAGRRGQVLTGPALDLALRVRHPRQPTPSTFYPLGVGGSRRMRPARSEALQQLRQGRQQPGGQGDGGEDAEDDRDDQVEHEDPERPEEPQLECAAGGDPDLRRVGRRRDLRRARGRVQVGHGRARYTQPGPTTGLVVGPHPSAASGAIPLSGSQARSQISPLLDTSERAQTLRMRTHWTRWSASLRRIAVARPRVGRMFWARLGPLMLSHSCRAWRTASSGVSTA